MKLLDQLVAERAEIATAVEAVLDRAAEETRDLTETEDSNLADLTTRAKTIDARIADLREIQISHLEAAKLRADCNARVRRASRGCGTAVPTPLTSLDSVAFGLLLTALVPGAGTPSWWHEARPCAASAVCHPPRLGSGSTCFLPRLVLHHTSQLQPGRTRPV